MWKQEHRIFILEFAFCYMIKIYQKEKGKEDAVL